MLAALARHRDVHLWLPHPSPVLWQRVAQVAEGVPARRADPTAELPVTRCSPHSVATSGS